MANSALELSRSFTSFSGCDIRVVIGGETLGSIQALSFAVQREKGPVYVMGSPDPLSFSRGKRGIAGTMVSLMLDQHPLLKAPFSNTKFVARNGEIYPVADNIQDASDNGQGLQDLNPVSSDTFDAGDLSANYTVMSPWYMDQVPPIDIVVVAANEYGQAATMRIYGAEFLNEGSGFSVDDMVLESQTTFVARSVLPWQVLGYWDFDSTEFIPGKRPQ